MAVSQEELVIHDSQVVCPQCLAVCRYDGNRLVVRDDSDAPYRHTANVETTKDDSKFCHSCGKQLPAGIRFCPYCGVDLDAPFHAAKSVNDVKPKAKETNPHIEKKKAEEEKAKPQPVTTRQRTSDHVEDKLRTITHRYNSSGSMRSRLHQNGTIPSKSFKLVAYAIIALLLILLVCIIIAGINIDTEL